MSELTSPKNELICPEGKYLVDKDYCESALTGVHHLNPKGCKYLETCETYKQLGGNHVETDVEQETSGPD